MKDTKDLLSFLGQANKAIVPLAVAGTLGLLALVGVTGDMTVKEALTLIFTSVVVWLVPNLKPKK